MTEDELGTMPIAIADGLLSFSDFLFISVDNWIFVHCLNAAS